MDRDINQELSLDKPREYPLGNRIDYYDRYSQEEEVRLRDYWRVILRRRWTIITFFVVVVTTVTVLSFLARPVYKAKATIQIDKENPNILYFKDVYTIERPEQDYYQTQYKVLQSRNLAKRVIKTLNLDKNPEFTGAGNRSLLQSIKDWVKGLASTSSEESDEESLKDDIKPGLIDAFLSNLDITPIRGSRLVTVSYSGYDPELSATITNTLARTFIDLNIESRIDASQQARDWLEKQLDVLKARVETSEERLNRYARENEIIGIDEKQNIVTQRLADISTALTQATSERIAKEALYRETEVHDVDSIPVVLNNPLIQKLKNDYSTLEAEYSQLSRVYKPEYPKMVRIQEQLNKIKTSIDKETKKIVLGIKSDYQTALKRENYLKSELDKKKKEALDLNERAIQYNILKREADTNKELYNGLLQRLKETGVSAGVTMTNIQILDRAEVPKVPDRPKKRLNIILAVLVGLFGGTGLAFFMEYLDNTVKAEEDIESHIRLPFLGLIPLYSGGHKGNPRPNPSKEIVTFNESNPWISEAYRTVRTSILFAGSGKPPKTIVFTSARIDEGKTTTALNTALTLVQTGAKILLIDGDMRRARLHSLLNLNNSKGLSSYLSGQQEIDTLQNKTRFPNLFVIPSGPKPPNPSELIGSKMMRDLLIQYSSLFDYIIIDSPPLLGLPDTIILSTMADGVILVIKACETPREAVQRSKKLLSDVNAKILGVVLNGVNPEGPDYKYYYSYYNYYYPDTGRKKSSRGEA